MLRSELRLRRALRLPQLLRLRLSPSGGADPSRLRRPRPEPMDYPMNDLAEDARRDLSSDVVRALVDNHRSFLAFLEKRTRNRELAEEILQNAFVRGIDRAGAVREGESAVAWFYRLLRNALVDHYRSRGAEARALEGLAREPGPADEELHEAVCQCVSALLPTLKPEYAEALRRIELDGQSVKDFAAETGISASNAGVRVFRARAALKQQLEQSCGTCATHGCLDCTCDAGGCA